MITVVIKITYIQDHYEILTFFLHFAGGDWATSGPLKLSRIDVACSYDDCGTFPWSQGRSAAAHTFPGGRVSDPFAQPQGHEGQTL